MPERQESGRRVNISAAVRRQVLKHGSCSYCGERYFPLTVDHVVPLSRGGTDSHGNLTAACWSCNFEKLDFTPEEWKNWRLESGQLWPPQSRSSAFIELLASDHVNTTSTQGESQP